MSRHDGSIKVEAVSPDRPSLGLQATGCLSDKLAHRALGRTPNRSNVPELSAEARDRLYARMFPSHICRGAKGDDESDPLS